jgi:hypothetical protein
MVAQARQDWQRNNKYYCLPTALYQEQREIFLWGEAGIQDWQSLPYELCILPSYRLS